MTLEPLERRIINLERQVAELQREGKSPAHREHVMETLGTIGDDPDFDEIVRSGREFRRHANEEGG